jgi:hypothetical protein
MATYYSQSTFIVRNITPQQIEEWQILNDPRGTDFIPIPPPPPYEPSTHNPPIFENGVWVEVLKTQEELDEFAKQEELRSEETQMRLIITALKNGVGTAGERITRVERVCAYLLNRLL